jgi:hypothetical protein
MLHVAGMRGYATSWYFKKSRACDYAVVLKQVSRILVLTLFFCAEEDDEAKGEAEAEKDAEEEERIW